MRLVVGDRATIEAQGQRLDIAEIVATSARMWVRQQLYRIDLNREQ